MTVAELNHILDIGNAFSIVARAALVFYLIWFLATEFTETSTHVGESPIVPDYVRRWAICLGTAILLWAAGAWVLTIGVQFWRAAGEMIGFWLMLFGELIAVIGNLLLLRTLSVKRWGETLWVIVAAIVVLVGILMLFRVL